MKLGSLQRPAFCLLFAVALLSCTGSAQTAIYVGKCSSYNWTNNCSGASNPNLCPSSGAGNCNMVISDSGGVAIAKQQGSSATNINYVCVQPGTTVQWSSSNATQSFVVNFGTTTPFTSKAIFAGMPGATASDSIVSSGSSTNECNEYVIMHCGATSCTMGDPIVVVHGGITLKGKTAHGHKPSASKKQ